MDGNVQPAQRIAYQASWQDCIVAISLGTISQALTAIESSPSVVPPITKAMRRLIVDARRDC
jgi:hypothetical protein